MLNSSNNLENPAIKHLILTPRSRKVLERSDLDKGNAADLHHVISMRMTSGVRHQAWSSRKDFEQAEADAARTLAEVQRAEARTRMYGGTHEANGVNQELAISASIKGVVVERNLNPGQEVRPDQSGVGVPPLFVVTDPTTLWVQIDARESEIDTLRPGAPFELIIPTLPGQKFEGRVTAAAENAAHCVDGFDSWCRSFLETVRQRYGDQLE